MQYFRITESKNDWTVTRILREIINQFKKNFSTFQNSKYLAMAHGNIGTPVEPPIIPLTLFPEAPNLVVTFKEHNFPVPAFSSGGANAKKNFIRVDVLLSKNFQDQHLEILRQEMLQTLIHEFEHLGQSGPEYETAALAGKNWHKSLAHAETYMLVPAEAKARVTNIYRLAKTRKEPFDKVLDDFLKKLENNWYFQFLDKDYYPNERMFEKDLKRRIENIRKHYLELVKDKFLKVQIN